jgi:hypothetical protein
MEGNMDVITAAQISQQIAIKARIRGVIGNVNVNPTNSAKCASTTIT